jgi:outer membrane protein TolC
LKRPRRLCHFALINAWALTAGLLSSLFALPSAFAAESMDLKHTLELALEHSPEFESAGLTAKNAELSYKNARASLLPQLDLQLNHQYARGGTGLLTLQDGAQSPWSNALNLRLSENLYDNGESLRQLDLSSIAQTVSTISLEKSKNSLLLKVLDAYFNYSLAVGSLQLQREQLETLRVQLRSIESRYRQGLTSNRDYLRTKAQVQRAEISIYTKGYSVESSRSSLRTAIGTNEQIDFVPYVPALKAVAGLDFPNVEAEDSFDFKLAALQDKTSELEFRSVQRNYYPRLSLQGNYSYNLSQYIGPRDFAGSPLWNAQAMLVLDYNLWDWGIRKRNVDIARNKQSIDRNAQQNTRINLTQNLITLKAQIKELRQTFQLNQEILRVDEDAFGSLQRAYRDGKVSYLDLITALNDLYGSRNELLSLEFELLKAQANLAYYQGRVYETVQGF